MSIDLLTAAKVHGLTIRKDGDRIFLNDIEAYPEGTSYVVGDETFPTAKEAAAYVWLLPYLRQERRSLSVARRDMAKTVVGILQEGNLSPVNELHDYIDDVKEAVKNLQDALNRQVA